MIRTPFLSNSLREPENPAYAKNPAIMRTDVPLESMRGDQAKVVAAIIDLAELERPPRRQLLGSDANALVRDALTGRLQEAESGREVAFTTDVDGFDPDA